MSWGLSKDLGWRGDQGRTEAVETVGVVGDTMPARELCTASPGGEGHPTRPEGEVRCLSHFVLCVQTPVSRSHNMRKLAFLALGCKNVQEISQWEVGDLRHCDNHVVQVGV